MILYELYEIISLHSILSKILHNWLCSLRFYDFVVDCIVVNKQALNLPFLFPLFFRIKFRMTKVIHNSQPNSCQNTPSKRGLIN